ncbi:MAG: adenylate/guanylate cyclase domain-containing protein [Candidatus Riflebacteria bacterium]|nr:adenylate/guanylate cyclase domain-containing protein [Candidatus Riflebacteria bacterium]
MLEIEKKLEMPVQIPFDLANAGKSIFLWLLFFFITYAIPAYLFQTLLKELNSSLRTARVQIQEEKAEEILNSLEQELNISKIAGDGLYKFKKKAENFLGNSFIDQENTRKLNLLFFRSFPRVTTLIWFDNRGELITPRGDPAPIQGKRSWKSLFQALSLGSKTSGVDEMLSKKVAKSLMGSLLTLDMLRENIPFRPQKVLFRNHPHLFSFFPLKSSKDGEILGNLIVFVPLDRAKKDWEVNRVVNKFGKNKKETLEQKIQIGGIRISNGESYSQIDPGFMAYLQEKLFNKNPKTTMGKRFYLAQLKKDDPDLMLAVGVGNPRGLIPFLEFVTDGLLGMIIPLGIFWALITILRSFGVIKVVQSLKMKFVFGIVLLTGMPLSALLINQLNFLTSVYQVQKREMNGFLENLLFTFEQLASEEQIIKEKEMREELRQISESKVNDNDMILNFLKKEFKSGSLSAFFVRKNGKPVFEDFRSILTGKTVSNFNSQEQLGFSKAVVFTVALELLKQFNFPVQRIEKKEFKTSDGGIRELIQASIKKSDAIKYVGKFQSFSLGTSSGLFYSNYHENMKGEQDSFLFCSYYFQPFRKMIIERALKRFEKNTGISSDNLFFRIKGINKNLSKEFEENSRKMLELVGTTEDQLIKRVTIGGREYLFFARPIKTFETVFGIFFPVDHFPRPVLSGVISILGILILAIFGAFFSAAFLMRFHLTPLMEFTLAVEKVDNGDYSELANENTGDEIGVLGRSFNEMLTGLREKERMSSFLSSDLITDAGKPETQSQVSRQKVAVIFSGLRGFSQLERNLSPEEALGMMSRFLGICTNCVKANLGEIDKFIGDTAMAVFRDDSPSVEDPESDADRENKEESQPERYLKAEQKAVLAALSIKKEMEKWGRNRKLVKLPPLRFGIGIASGEALAGKIGSLLRRLDFTVIGDTVNLAARLEKLAGTSGLPQILAIEEVFKTQHENIDTFPVNIETVQGRQGKVKILGIRDAIDEKAELIK